MKNTIAIVSLLFLLFSCTETTKEVETSSDSYSSKIEELNAQKSEYTQQINDLSLKLEKVNEALEAMAGSEKRVLVTAFETKTEAFEHTIEVQANIKTRQNVLLYPEFAGRLLKLYAKEGQAVKKGQLLAAIDDAGVKDQLEQMKLQLELAKTTFERTQRLWEQKIGSEMMFLEAQTRYKASQKQVDQMKQQLAKTKVYAPFSGIIDEIPALVGSNLAPGITPILRIVNLNSMYAESDVPENYLTNITKGSKAIVNIPVLKQMQTTEIVQTGNFITPTNRTFRVEASLKNPAGLIKPNLNARLSMVDYSNPEAIMVPFRVVRENAEGKSYVFVLIEPESNEGYTTEQRIVSLGKSKNEKIEVTSGLQKGELVVDEGVSLLVADQKVKRILE